MYPRNREAKHTSRLKRVRSSFSRFAFSSCACFIRACLRLWKPVKYSSRAAKSNVISCGSLGFVLRFFEGGGMAEYSGRVVLEEWPGRTLGVRYLGRASAEKVAGVAGMEEGFAETWLVRK